MATSAPSTGAASKRSNSASRPATSDAPASRSSVEPSGQPATAVDVAKIHSKVGSLQNAAYKPGGGAVKISSQKLHWNAKSKIGSLDNANHKPGGGVVKIESKKLVFKEKAKPKTNSGLRDSVTSPEDGEPAATSNGTDGATSEHQSQIIEQSEPVSNQ